MRRCRRCRRWSANRPTPSVVRLQVVIMPVFTVLGAIVMVVAYTFGVPGPVCAILFLAGVFTGAFLQYTQPIIEWIRRP